MCPVAVESVAGVKRRPAAPCAIVMNAPLPIGVVPSFWNSVPPVMFVTWTCVTSAPSAALRLTTRPDVVCVLVRVEAFVIDGVSATAVTLMTPPLMAVPPLSVPAASTAPMTRKVVLPK